MKIRWMMVCGFLAYQMGFGSPFIDSVQDSLSIDSTGSTFTVSHSIGLEAFEIGKQFVGGQLFGLVGSLAGIILSKPFVENDDAWSGFAVGMQGMYVGYVIGNTLGVYVAGNDRYHRGPYLPSLMGAIVGTAIGYRIYHLDDRSHLGALGIWLGAPLGSMIGFNLFREDRTGIKAELFPASIGTCGVGWQTQERWIRFKPIRVTPLFAIRLPLNLRKI